MDRDALALRFRNMESVLPSRSHSVGSVALLV